MSTEQWVRVNRITREEARRLYDPTPENVETRCVPLCNADNAHGGVAVPWWKHDQLCPARERGDFQ